VLVPLWEERVCEEVDRIHLFRRDGDGGWMMFGVEGAIHDQGGVGLGGLNQPEDSGIIGQGLPRPGFADLAEEPMLDGKRLGGAAGIVANGHGEVERVRQDFLQA